MNTDSLSHKAHHFNLASQYRISSVGLSKAGHDWRCCRSMSSLELHSMQADVGIIPKRCRCFKRLVGYGGMAKLLYLWIILIFILINASLFNLINPHSFPTTNNWALTNVYFKRSSSKRTWIFFNSSSISHQLFPNYNYSHN